MPLAFSPVHLATSYEMLMGFLGYYLRIDPLYFYQVVGHAFTAFFASICFLLVRPNFWLEPLAGSGGRPLRNRFSTPR